MLRRGLSSAASTVVSIYDCLVGDCFVIVVGVPIPFYAPSFGLEGWSGFSFIVISFIRLSIPFSSLVVWECCSWHYSRRCSPWKPLISIGQS